MVTEDILKSLRKSSPVKSAHDIRQLSHELHNAYHILNYFDSLNEVNAEVTIFDIDSRLRKFAQNNWSKNEFKSKHNSGTYLKFEDLVDFVNEFADEMNGPLCSTAAKAECSH